MIIRINPKNLSFIIEWNEHADNSNITPYVCDDFEHFKNLYYVLLKDIAKEYFETHLSFSDRCEKEGI